MQDSRRFRIFIHLAAILVSLIERLQPSEAA